MKLVRVVAPHFVGGFETDGTIRRTAPILKQMRGWPDERARRYMARKGWRAAVIPDQMTLELAHGRGRQGQADPGQIQGPAR